MSVQTIDERTERAATESMAVARVGGTLYEVYSGRDGRYLVEMQSGACTCPDWEYREPEGGCKHRRRVLMTLGELDVPDVERTDSVIELQRVKGV